MREDNFGCILKEQIEFLYLLHIMRIPNNVSNCGYKFGKYVEICRNMKVQTLGYF